MEVDRLEYIISASNAAAIQAFKETEAGIDSLSTKVSKFSAGSVFSSIESGAGKAATAMATIGTVATLASVPVALLAKNSISAFANLESQIQRNTALLGGGKAEYEEILTLSKELGASTPFDAQQIAEGVQTLAAAGYSLDEIKTSMSTVAEMAIATGDPLSSMSDILIGTLSSYGESADKASVYGDKLATVANMSTASFSDIGESMKYVGSVASTFGIDIDELGSAISVLANRNIKGSMAGTGILGMISDLSAPTAKSQAILEKYGLTMEEVNPATNEFIDILKRLNEVDMSESDTLSLFGQIAGPKAFALITDEAIAEYEKAYDTLKNKSEGMLDVFTQTMKKTVSYAMEEMQGTLTNVSLAIGEGLKPIVLEVAKWVNDNQDMLTNFAKNAVDGLKPIVETFLEYAEKIMDWFNSLPDDMQSKIATFTGLATALTSIGGPLLILSSIPLYGISSLSGVLASLATSAVKISAGAGLTGLITGISGLGTETALATPAIAALFGPAGILAVGLGAGALAAYATNFGDFRTNVNSILSELGSAATNISTGDYEEAGKDCAEALGKGFETVTDLVKETVISLPSAVTGVSNFVTGAEKAGEEWGIGFGEGISDGIESCLGPVSLAIRLITSENAAKDEIPNAIRGWFSGFSLAPEGKTLSGTLIDGFLSQNFGVLASPIKGIISGFIDDEIGDIKRKIAELYGVTYTEVNKELEKHGVGGKWLSERDNPGPTSYSPMITSSGSAVKPTDTVVLDAKNIFIDGENASKSTTGKTGFELFKTEKNEGLSDREKYTDESLRELYTGKTKENYDSLAASSNGVKSANLAQKEAIKENTDAQKDQKANVTDVIKGVTDADTAIQKLVSAGYTQTEAVETWENRFSSSADTVKTYSNSYSGALKTATDNTQDYSNTVKSADVSISDAGKGVESTFKNIADYRALLDSTGDRSPGIAAYFTDQQVIDTLIAESRIPADTKIPSAVTTPASSKQTGTLKDIDSSLTGDVTLKSDNIRCVFSGTSNIESTGVESYLSDLSKTNKSYISQVRDSWGWSDSRSVDTGQVSAAAGELTSQISAMSGSFTGLSGNITPLTGVLDSLSSSLQNLTSYVTSAVNSINAAVASANSAISGASSSLNNIKFGQQYASGGEVKQTGQATVHAGEYVLNRNDVKDLKSTAQVNSGVTQHVHIDLRNSRIDNSSTKSLPKQIAKATKQSLARSG